MISSLLKKINNFFVKKELSTQHIDGLFENAQHIEEMCNEFLLTSNRRFGDKNIRLYIEDVKLRKEMFLCLQFNVCVKSITFRDIKKKALIIYKDTI